VGYSFNSIVILIRSGEFDRLLLIDPKHDMNKSKFGYNSYMDKPLEPIKEPQNPKTPKPQ
jgi:hypothetical protein